MTTKHSPLSAIRQQAERVAKFLKEAEQKTVVLGKDGANVRNQTSIKAATLQ